ncbi:hypothetical protein HGRIS_009884 [Hohenbuehelia grisea]|uniref:J domain-containing protein n=1 Tax=Hohenbuehelia grisea TaxID=104357 RepID=A0ABR3J2S8_9AGAR
MANYNYDEGGQMAGYFVISFLALILVPLTLSSLSKPSAKRSSTGCKCQKCATQRARVAKRERGSILNPKFSKKTIFLVVGWALLGYMSYKSANAKFENKIYDPFEILGIKMGTSQKEIKSHFKKLSRKFHPDKVKLSGNETIEEVANRFVDITKAYKSLTDETIRKNWELYGHPDGKQEMSMGIALPSWLVEGKNNIWVLGFYGLIIGGALPLLVGRWWFGYRQKTKDGIQAKSAAAFFKGTREESSMADVIGCLGKAYEFEPHRPAVKSEKAELETLEGQIKERVGKKWTDARKLVEGDERQGPAFETRWKALVLIYAHLLRLPVSSSLQNDQTAILLQTPLLLNALLQISISRNWLRPTIAVMRLHAHLAQAVLPAFSHNDSILKSTLTQLPGVDQDEVDKLPTDAPKIDEFATALEEKRDGRAQDAKEVLRNWGRIELVDASFQVIGERIVTPASIVFLVVKLRISPPGSTLNEEKDLGVDETKRLIKYNEEKDQEFLLNKENDEPLEDATSLSEWAHAPYWPGNRKPSWWVLLADDKTQRVIVPPMKVTDVPFSRTNADRNYRSYKMQFQAPQSVGLFTWKLYVVSDTFVGEEVTRGIELKIDDVSALNADEQASEDEISEPDEDTLAGQMAAMRGGKVKKRDDEESDDESTTDGDEGDDSSSDSDSD